MKKINLIYVVTSLQRGGVQSHILDLVRGLDKARYEISVAYGIDGEIGDDLIKSGVRVIKVEGLKKKIAPISDVTAFINLIGLIRKLKPDIVHNVAIKPVVYGSIATLFTSEIGRAHV